jgi:hypothetical protein
VLALSSRLDSSVRPSKKREEPLVYRTGGAGLRSWTPLTATTGGTEALGLVGPVSEVSRANRHSWAEQDRRQRRAGQASHRRSDRGKRRPSDPRRQVRPSCVGDRGERRWGQPEKPGRTVISLVLRPALGDAEKSRNRLRIAQVAPAKTPQSSKPTSNRSRHLRN